MQDNPAHDPPNTFRPYYSASGPKYRRLLYYNMDEDYPVIAKEEGIVIKAERMEVDRIYQCVYQNRVYLFFKDEDELLNCYEVEDEEAAEAIKANPDSDSVKRILQEAARKQQKKE
jgi:hypothetical protein